MQNDFVHTYFVLDFTTLFERAFCIVPVHIYSTFIFRTAYEKKRNSIIFDKKNIEISM